jgi:hypothetical protein
VSGCVRCVGYAVRTFLAVTVQGDGGPGDHWDVWVPMSWIPISADRPEGFEDLLERLEGERPAFLIEPGEPYAYEQLGDPFQVNATMARSLPFGHLLDLAVREYAEQHRVQGKTLEMMGVFAGRTVTLDTESGPLSFSFPGSPEEARRQLRLADDVESATRARKAREPTAGVSLERIAAKYECFWRDGSRSPTRDLAEAFGMSRSTAAKRVMRCRQAGLLAPTRRGIAGGVEEGSEE